jgi:hypothetical protein
MTIKTSLLVRLFLLAAVLINIVRLPLTTPPAFMTDFRPVYTACRTFAAGENPYDDTKIKETWSHIAAAEHLDERAPGLPESTFLYPPSILLLFQPYTLLDWTTAKYVHLAVTSLCLLGIGFVVLRYGPGGEKSRVLLAGTLLFLAWKSNWLGVVIGQPAFFSMVCALCALVLDNRNKTLPASVLLAFACVKQTMALPFFLYFLLKRRYALVGVALGVTVVLNLLPFIVLPLHAATDYVALVQSTFEPGQSNDYSMLNPRFVDITSVQTLINIFVPSRTVVSLLFYVLLAGAVVFFFIRRKQLEDRQWLVYFCFCTLFFTYHRFSDTILLATILLTLSPVVLLRRLSWKIILLGSLLFPVTGIAQYGRDVLPTWLYHIMALSITWGVVITFVLWLQCALQEKGRETLPLQTSQ